MTYINPANEQTHEVYLDANATTPVLPCAARAAAEAMATDFGNPSSSHVTGLKAKHLLETTRGLISDYIGGAAGHLIFISGATEGIQTSILSALNQGNSYPDTSQKPCLMYGATEHKAVPRTLKHWNQILGFHADVLEIPVDQNGQLDLTFIEKHMPHCHMICTMAVNNETGAYQDLDKLESVIRAGNPNALWLVDCVQALGKLKLDLASTSIDYAVFSGHKLYAPKGIGILYQRKTAPFTPCIAGGGQEEGRRSGTENLPGVAALGAIFRTLLDPEDTTFHPDKKLHAYRHQLAETLKQAFPTLVFNQDFQLSIPTTLNFSVKGFSSKEMIDLFDAADIRVSSGSACSSKVTRSFVLDAMGIEAWRSESAIRMSFGPASTQAEIDFACQRIQKASDALKAACPFISDRAYIEETHGVDGLIQLKYGGSCSWLLVDQHARDCVIVEPIEELSPRLEAIIRHQQLTVHAILDTHSHADHTSCAEKLSEILSDHIPTHIDLQKDHLGWPETHTEQVVLSNDISVPTLKVGRYHLARVSTPGHTQDSQTYLVSSQIENRWKKEDIAYAFVGDTILINALGRSNFQCSSTASMYRSLLQLRAILDDETLLCCAHDYQNEFVTNLKTEQCHNPLLQKIFQHPPMSLEHFIVQKQRIDAQLIDQEGEEIMCGQYTGMIADSPMRQLTGEQVLDEYGDQCLLIDIREPYEISLYQESHPLIEQIERVNIPLTKLTQFIGDYQSQPELQHRPLIFICRSGNRSALAASTLRRLGYHNSAHIMGGYALNEESLTQVA
ncbi:aminotransferase class V-fold PLP-dependent enzyme [Algicola sagamiensis]|uniref:aminotransferase class V-fold PLP-dependent enzyme n=1 Tax=Algicola sagamiensis TaxID=163869 RepID=UPI00037FA102|nr:aminotransferase class V-fold PLP-dependent enzyme [Algicola sagamiensis]